MKKKSSVVYQDNMGNIHIWKHADLNKFQQKGLHHADSRVNGRSADIFLQNNPEFWAKRNLSSAQRSNLNDGYPIRKRTFHDFEDSWMNPYGDKNHPKRRKGKS